MTTDADRQSAVEAAARLCYLATLGVVDKERIDGTHSHVFRRW
jgi:hypothetical protein